MRPAGDWIPPVVSTCAVDGAGLSELAAAVDAHRRHLRESPEGERRRAVLRLRRELAGVIAAELAARAEAVAAGEGFDRAVEALAARATDPWEAAAHLLGEDSGP